MRDRLLPGDHVCVWYDDDRERSAAVSRFVAAGLGSRQKVLYFGERSGLGPVEGSAWESRQLMVVPGGQRGFDARAKVASWPGLIAEARDEGWSGLRVASDMAWARRGSAAVGGLDWYEAESTRAFSGDFATAICCYPGGESGPTQVGPAHTGTVHASKLDAQWQPQLRLRRDEAMARGSIAGGSEELAVIGEVDVSNRDGLVAVLHGMAADSGPEAPVVLNLAGMRFVDVATVRDLVEVAHTRSAGLVLRSCPGVVRRMIQLIDARPGRIRILGEEE